MATFLFLSLFAAGCGADPCHQLCEDAAQSLDPCLDGWGVTWEELGADGWRAWRNRCQSDWDSVRADLEAREVPASEEQCSDAQEDLATLSCDELRVLYLE